jgi:uncharacterized membrane protein YeiH
MQRDHRNRRTPRNDLMVAVLAEITAIGSDVVCDLILGATPPSAFTDHLTFLLPVGDVAL